MKNRIFLTLALLTLFSMAPMAQQVSFGLRGGLNMQNINGKDFAGDALEMKLVPRFHAGVVVDIPVAPEFWFEPGLLFSTKGAKSDGNFLGLSTSVEYNLSYIELPLNLVYKPALGSGNFFLGFGPYVGYAVAGKATYGAGSLSSEQDITFEKEFDGSENDYSTFRRLDYGGNLFFGYQFNAGFSLQLNTQLGMAAINSENSLVPDDETAFRNTGFGLSLGYNFQAGR
jgi:hypothetical protein